MTRKIEEKKKNERWEKKKKKREGNHFIGLVACDEWLQRQMFGLRKRKE